MLLTREADYALRLMRCLGERGEKTDAQALATQACIPFRFALKILRKLSMAELVRSKLGAGGGYYLARSPDEITLYDVLTGIGEGPDWNRCTDEEGYICEYRDAEDGCRGCAVHMMLVQEKQHFEDTLRATPLRRIMLGTLQAEEADSGEQNSLPNNHQNKQNKENESMKYRCSVCGYIHEGDEAPAKCPQCGVPASKFVEIQEEKLDWAAEHVVGVAEGAPEDIIEGLRANFTGECTEVGMYLAMARVAHREGYPEIGLYWEKAAYEEAEHAAKFAELLGEVVSASTKENLTVRVAAENGATAGKFELAKRAKELGLDAIHDTVHEMARDEARHGKAFEGLLKRYFAK